ncbi:MAG: Sip1-related alpha-galactosidase [Thermoproteota archaeon]
MRYNLTNAISLEVDEERNLLLILYGKNTIIKGKPLVEWNGKVYSNFKLEANEHKDGIEFLLHQEGFKASLVIKSYGSNAIYLYYDKVPKGDGKNESIGFFEFDILRLYKMLVYHLGKHPIAYNKAFGYYTPREAGLKTTSEPPSEPVDYPPKIEEVEQKNEFSQDAFSFPILLKDISYLSENVPIVFMLVKTLENISASFLPSSDYGYKSLIRVNGKAEDLRIKVKSRNFTANNFSEKIPLLSIAFNEDPYEAIAASVQCLRESSSVRVVLRNEKKFPDVFNYLGWCSWNSYLHSVSEEKILNSIYSFSRNKIPVGFIIIDDGWLSVRDGKLTSFYPDKEKFPNGFKKIVQIAKSNGIKFVGVWHTLQGYWGGIDAESFSEYKESLMRDQLKLERYLPSPEKLRGFRFFHDWYSYLSKEGISFVKVDNQNDQPTYFLNNIPNQEGAKNLQHSLQAAAYGAGMEILNCMCMGPENYFNWIRSNVARASSDYIPGWKNGTKFHIFFCVYNSLWYSSFAWPDFDMFTTYDPYAWIHAVFRAISGGPVYFTDRYDKASNLELIKKLALSDGRIPKPDEPALPTKDVIFEDVYNTRIPVKARSFVNVEGFGRVGLVVVANINKNGETEDYLISPSDLFNEEGEYLVYDWRANNALICKLKDAIKGKLSELDWKLYIISPLSESIGIVGLVDVFVSPKGISRLERVENSLILRLEDSGTFKIFVGNRKVKAVAGSSGKYNYDENLSMLHTYKTSEGMLEFKSDDETLIICFS